MDNLKVGHFLGHSVHSTYVNLSWRVITLHIHKIKWAGRMA